MSDLCRADHVFREPLPGGLALHPFGHRYHHEEGWLADEDLLAHIDRLDAPAVYLDMSTVDVIGSAGLQGIVRLGKRAHDRGGRVVLCDLRQHVRDVFQVSRLDRVPWLEIRGGGMPGGGRPQPDPAWLAWGGGVVAAMARSFAESRDLGLMPVLGDALEEAGCTDAELLGHLRGPGPHDRECWTIRFLLGTS